MARSKKPSTVQPMYLSIADVATMLSLGRTKVYDLIKHEGLPTIQFGDVKRVPVAKLQRWLEARGRQTQVRVWQDRERSVGKGTGCPI